MPLVAPQLSQLPMQLDMMELSLWGLELAVRNITSTPVLTLTDELQSLLNTEAVVKAVWAETDGANISRAIKLLVVSLYYIRGFSIYLHPV